MGGTQLMSGKLFRQIIMVVVNPGERGVTAFGGPIER
jgi:hypothetical protein